MKPVIYIVQELHDEQVEMLRTKYGQFDIFTKWEGLPKNRMADVEIILGGTGQDSDEIMSIEGNKLKWIQARSAGTDFWNINKLKSDGVMLSSAAGLHGDSIAEHVMGMLLLDVRDFRTILKLQDEKKWGRNIVKQRQLSGQNMLILGVGRVGSCVGKLASAFGVNVYGIDLESADKEGFKKVYALDQLDEVLGEIDIIVNTLPLTKSTEYFYDEKFFSKVKKGAKFINVGRGKSVKEADLLKAIKQDIFSFVYLDVYEEEPLPEDSILWTEENVVISPHVAGMMTKFKANLLNRVFLPNLNSYIEKQSLIVNRIV